MYYKQFLYTLKKSPWDFWRYSGKRPLVLQLKGVVMCRSRVLLWHCVDEIITKLATDSWEVITHLTSVHLYLRVDLFHQVPQIYLQTNKTLAQGGLRLSSFASSLLSSFFRRIPLSLQVLPLNFQVSPEGLEVVRGQTQPLSVLNQTHNVTVQIYPRAVK